MLTTEGIEQYHSKYDLGTQLIIDALPFGDYVLAISHSNDSPDGAYKVQMYCDKIIPFTCGDSLSGEITRDSHHFETHYENYLIRIPTKKAVLFDSCRTDENIWLRVEVDGLESSKQRTCPDTHTQFLFILEQGDHHLTIEMEESRASWNVDMICSDLNSSEAYIPSFEYLETPNSWTNAQLECLQKYGTSLATIKTQEDIDVANKVVQRMMHETAIGTDTVNLYIGLYSHTPFGDGWGWIDGTVWYE